jgi:hypothetical protein
VIATVVAIMMGRSKVKSLTATGTGLISTVDLKNLSTSTMLDTTMLPTEMSGTLRINAPPLKSLSGSPSNLAGVGDNRRLIANPAWPTSAAQVADVLALTYPWSLQKNFITYCAMFGDNSYLQQTPNIRFCSEGFPFCAYPSSPLPLWHRLFPAQLWLMTPLRSGCLLGLFK